MYFVWLIVSGPNNVIKLFLCGKVVHYYTEAFWVMRWCFKHHGFKRKKRCDFKAQMNFESLFTRRGYSGITNWPEELREDSFRKSWKQQNLKRSVGFTDSVKVRGHELKVEKRLLEGKKREIYKKFTEKDVIEKKKKAQSLAPDLSNKG